MKDVQEDQNRKHLALMQELREVRETLAQEMEVKVRLQGKIYDQLERNLELDDSIARLSRDLKMQASEKDQAEQGKAAAQRTAT